jgi:hypothetical protein
MTSATVHIAATEMPIATALRQKDSGDIASLPLDYDASRLYGACKPLGSNFRPVGSRAAKGAAGN